MESIMILHQNSPMSSHLTQNKSQSPYSGLPAPTWSSSFAEIHQALFHLRAFAPADSSSWNALPPNIYQAYSFTSIFLHSSLIFSHSMEFSYVYNVSAIPYPQCLDLCLTQRQTINICWGKKNEWFLNPGKAIWGYEGYWQVLSKGFEKQIKQTKQG